MDMKKNHSRLIVVFEKNCEKLFDLVQCKINFLYSLKSYLIISRNIFISRSFVFFFCISKNMLSNPIHKAVVRSAFYLIGYLSLRENDENKKKMFKFPMSIIILYSNATGNSKLQKRKKNLNLVRKRKKRPHEKKKKK